MKLPALNGTTIYAEQVSNYFKAEVISSNALNWKAVYKKGRTGEGHKILHNPLFKNSGLFVKLKEASRKYSFINSMIRGPVTPGMLGALLRKDFDVIYSITLPFFNNYIALMASRLKRKKSVISPFYIKGVVPDSYSKLLKKYDLVLACTEYERKCLKKLCVRNVKLNPIGINLKPFKKADGKRFRKKYGVNEDERMVLFVGNANHEKGAYTILKAAGKVKARFVFLGPRTPGFKSRAKGLKNVLLVNPQLRNKYDAFSACDVYAMPSRVEAFGITYLEAWAVKKPVIAADTPQAREVIGSDGLLVKFGDEEALAGAINESFNRKDLGRSGYKKLVKKYTEDKVMKELSNLISQQVY